MSNETKSKEDVMDQVMEKDHLMDFSSYSTPKEDDWFDGKCHHVFDAMDEWAKIKGIDFLKWKEQLGLVKEQGSENWLINYSMNEMSLFAENDEQLYELFISQTQKTTAHD